MLQDILCLLVAYQAKHFFCDFPLQTQYMLGKFKAGFDWIVPLASHALVHALGTLLIGWFYLGEALQKDKSLSLVLVCVVSFDFICHFIIDRIKAAPSLLGRYHPLSPTEFHDLLKYDEQYGEDQQSRLDKKNNKYFWWSLGLDQTLHHLTHYIIIIYLITKAH